MTKSQNSTSARNHHLDRRADQIASLVDTSNDDTLLSTSSVAAWLGLSHQWLEIGRVKGYGPPFRRISVRCVRYRVGDVRQWLMERAHASTAAYSDPKTSKRIQAAWDKKRAAKLRDASA